MEKREKFEYWHDIAHYDLETADAMFTAGRWLYVVFMCQQAVEKLCKGLYLLFIDDNVPLIHDVNSSLSIMWTHYRQTTLKTAFSQPLGENNASD